jgi:hypothetical protein
MPELISPQWAQHLQDVLTHVGTAVLAAMGGWLTKHKQAQSQHSTLAERDAALVALMAPHTELRMNAIEQVALITRSVTLPDADGFRISFLRRILETLTHTSETQTRILERMEAVLDRREAQVDRRLGELEETWHGEERRKPKSRKEPE